MGGSLQFRLALFLVRFQVLLQLGEALAVLLPGLRKQQHRVIDHGYFVREVRPRFQVKEVLARFDLYRLVKPFSRCTRCNGELRDVDKAEVIDRLEPKTKKYFDVFKLCAGCQQIYWQGSHYERSKKLIAEFRRVPE